MKKNDTFNRIILNILSNFIQHEFKGPPWLNKILRAFIQEINTAFKKLW